MGGRRRSQLAVESERRMRALAGTVGARVRAARERRGWTQAERAKRAGVGRMVIGRLERGVGRLDLDVLHRVAIALDLALAVTLGRDPLEAPAVAGHLAIQELILRLGRAAGRRGRFELATRPAEPWRSIDIGFVDDPRRCLIVIECWNTIGDIGAAARGSTCKRAEAAAAAVALWGKDGRAALVWVVRATARNRNLIARYPEVFAARFPGSSRRWVEALVHGTEPPSEDGLVWADVAGTRLFAWRRAS